MPLKEHLDKSVKSFTVLCMGDSHTAGYPGYDPLMGGNPESSYQFWLREGLLRKHPKQEFRLVNQGLCGDTSRGIVARLFHTLETVRCDLAILAGGTNDLGMMREEQVIKNLKEGYDACRDRKIPLIAPSIPPICLEGYNAGVKKINRAIEDYASTFRTVFFADWFGALKDEDGHLADRFDAGDGVHLSITGYERIGTLLVPLVCQALFPTQ